MQLLFSFLLAAVIVYIAASLKNFIWRKGLVPADEPPILGFSWPLVGGFPQVLWWSGHHLELDLESHKQWPEHPTFSWKVLHIRGMSTADPEVLKHVTQTNWSNYIKGDRMVHVFKEFLGEGIFAVNGAAWKHQRNVAKPMFRRASLQSMMPVMLQEGELLLEQLDKFASNENTRLDIQNMFMRYTLDSFCEIGLGHNVESLKRPVAFSAWFDYIQSEIYKRGTVPPREYLIYQKFNDAIKCVDDFVYRIIESRKKDKREDLQGKTDLLSKFLLMVDEETGKPFSDKYIRDIIMNFIIAGRDTTAILLTWTFYLLCTHPEVEKQVIAEIDDVFQGEAPSDWDKLQKLPYLKAVFDETLRLYPPVPSNFKQAVEDDVLPGGFVVRKGTWVQFNAYTMHRLKSLWGPDAEEFKPERWLEPGFTKKIHPFQYFPFHAGPRLCLGMNMAFLEAKIVICLVLQRYKVRLVPGTKVEHHQALTMPVKNGLPVFLEKRTQIPIGC